jgi:hypothetical protein
MSKPDMSKPDTSKPDTKKLHEDRRAPRPQPFTDESRAADEKRGRSENERMRTQEATEQDEKAAAVDEAHRLAR